MKPALSAPALALLLIAAGSGSAWAQQQMPAVPVAAVEQNSLPHKAHAIAMHGAPKYDAGFTHFPYVNPNAPKGGVLRLSAAGSFDSFNPYIARGDPAVGAGNESLLERGEDEAFTLYGLIAESIEWPEDRSWVIFTLRPEARWHDGVPITVDDVIFSLQTIKEKASPVYRFYFQDVLTAEKVGERRVKFTFAGTVNRELPLIVGGDMPILPKHYWETRDFSRTTLEPPLASGPYRIARFEAGRFVELERVEDYWGRDLPVKRGRHNFDRIRYDYFRDQTVVREALKAGNIDYFSENSAKEWATAYEVPAVRQGWLIKERFEDHSSGQMQGFCMNTRRPLFQNRDLRQAMAYAYDFSWTNERIYYGQYVHPDSYFFSTELASGDLPSGLELEILEPYRGRVPDEVFTQAYEPPTTDGSGWPRKNLERAFELLAEAGWVVRDMKLVKEDTGQPFRFEFLIQQKALERAILPYMRNLRRLGMDVRLRLVDTSQYINRLRAFDFDMIVCGSAQSLSPGNEQRIWWGSAAAEDAGSRNYWGIRDPVVDELIEMVISAPDRETLVATTQALDRVLLWGHYSVPNLAAPFDRLVFWDKFGRPETVPVNGPSITNWWNDPAKVEALRTRRAAVAEAGGDGGASGDRGGLADSLGFLALGVALVAGFFAVRQVLRRSHG
ncbi:MAG: extracellular solute-binding protein [Kiloniellales bacterium]